MNVNDSCKQLEVVRHKNNSSNLELEVLINLFADLMVERFFQDIDKDKKLYTKNDEHFGTH